MNTDAQHKRVADSILNILSITGGGLFIGDILRYIKEFGDELPRGSLGPTLLRLEQEKRVISEERERVGKGPKVAKCYFLVDSKWAPNYD